MKRWLWVVVAVAVGWSGGVEARQAEPRASGSANEPYRAAILIDAGSGTVLFEHEAHLVAPPASMTKMMLMLLVAERVRDGQLHWDDPIRTSTLASRMGGSQVYLKQGETFPLAEMMEAIVIHSANDAALAVAEAVAGSGPAFVELMNARARELGMRDTVYRSVHGLPPDKGQQPDLSSAYDLARLAREVVQFPDIMRWAGTKESTFRQGKLVLTNTNRLVRETSWVDGLKTGYFQQAGFNVTATAQRKGFRLIAVVLGVPDKRECFASAAALLTRGFTDYEALVAINQGDTVTNNLLVRDGKPRFVRVVAGSNLSVLTRRGQKRSFSFEVAVPGSVNAPLMANAAVGEVVVRDGDEIVGRVPALAADPVEKQHSVWDRLFN